MKVSDYQIKLMQHCCGLSNGENRNFFGTSKGYKDSDEFEKLVLMGLAISHDPQSWTGDTALYSLTKEGKRIAAEAMPVPEKLTRSKARYARYLEYGDGFNSFLEFCYWDAEKHRSWN